MESEPREVVKITVMTRDRIIQQLCTDTEYMDKMFGNDPVRLPNTDEMLRVCLHNQSTIMVALVDIMRRPA